MKRRDTNHLLAALEAAVAECRRLEERNRQLEEILALEEEAKYENEMMRERPKPRRSRNRKFTRDGPLPAPPLPMPQVQVAHRRSVDDIYREQKQKHADKIAKEAALALEQEQMAEEAYTAETKNQEPVQVRLSEKKKEFLIEAGKIAMDKTGN